MSRILASGTPIKMLVLNTGAYSNTGGQASKASNIGQVAQFAAAGKETKKKGLFVIRFHTRKSLDLDLSMIVIGDHRVTQKDVLTNPAYTPLGALPPGFTGDFAVAVPLESVKGASRRVSVGEYGADLEFAIK